MKPIIKLLLVFSLAHAVLTWSEEKPVEEDFCDAEWDGKVEYKEEGEQNQATPEEEQEGTEPPAEAEGEDEQKPDDAVTEQSEEGPTEEGKEPEEGPAGGEEQPGEQTGQEKTPKDSKEDERGDPRNTYDKSAELVRASANVDDVKDDYLRGSLDNRLQEHIRNPIIGAAGSLPSFKKIEPCFKTMKQDLTKEIEASKKEFADCKKKTDSSHECMVKMEPGFAAHVKSIGEKIVQCMNKSK